MAGIGEAASIAGLVSLAGQSLHGLVGLYCFVKAYENTIPESQAIPCQIDFLRDLVSRLSARSNQINNGLISTELVDRLSKRLRGCHSTLVAMELELLPIVAGGRGSSTRRLKVAARRKYFTTMHSKLTAEQTSLSLILSTAILYVPRIFELSMLTSTQ